MKRLLLALYLTLFCFLISYTQNDFEYGIGFGVNHVQLKLRNSDAGQESPYSGKWGFSVKTRFREHMSNVLSISIEPGISILRAESMDLSTAEAITLDLQGKMEFKILKKWKLTSGVYYQNVMGYSFYNSDSDLIIQRLRNENIFNLGLGINYDFTKFVELNIDCIVTNTSLFDATYTNSENEIVSSALNMPYLQMTFVYKDF